MKEIQVRVERLYRYAVGVLFFCGAFFTVFAQSETNSRFIPEIIMGVSSSQVSGDQLAGFDQLGLSGGVSVRMETGGHWRPGMDILFTQKGSRKNASPDKGDFDSYLLRLNYIQVPLYMSHQKEHIGFDLGVSYGQLVSSKEENQNGTVIGLGREFESGELSGIAGIRYNFAPQWTLTTRLDQSITAVRKHAGAAVFRLNRGQYNTVILFQIRYEPFSS